MLFEILRASDIRSGLVAEQALLSGPPCTSAIFNFEEKRWEVEVKDLADLLDLALDVDGQGPIRLFPVGGPDLPVLEIDDIEHEEND